VYQKDAGQKAKMSLWSPKSGVRMEVHSDQIAAQVYTAVGFDGSIPRKASQGGPSKTYGKMSAIALEQQSLIDGVNQPDWKVKQFLKPGEEYKWEATYSFAVADKA
jgi:aldose 1-epimerase